MDRHGAQNDLQKQLVDYDDVELDESASGLLASTALAAPSAETLTKMNGGMFGSGIGHGGFDHMNSGSSTCQNSLNAINNPMINDEKHQRKQLQFTGIHSTGFKDFLLRPELMKAIVDCGFEHPSEVQQECIPQSIMGVDVLCQAKSGMGKTAVFVLTTLHQLGDNPKPLSGLILCHTRELAFQIKKEYDRFLKHIDKEQASVAVMYGGEPFRDHVNFLKKTPPTILVGTPGRILALARGEHLPLANLKHFVLDECDKMLEALDMRQDVQSIFKLTPHAKQVQMFSATMNIAMRAICKKFMKTPFEVTIDNETGLTLHGLQQYYLKLEENQKNRKLVDMLDALQFNQVIIFVKTTKRADALNKLLCKNSFPSMCIHSSLSQQDRIAHFEDFKNFKKRIMVATDIFGRGIDVERVNIVVNYDMPDSSDQYLHRVGRAGRFGTKGLSVSFVADEEDETVLSDTQKRFEVKIKQMPSSIESSTYMTA